MKSQDQLIEDICLCVKDFGFQEDKIKNLIIKIVSAYDYEYEIQNLGRTWYEIRHKQTGRIVFSSDEEAESQYRFKDCWPVGEYELVNVREIKKS